MNRVYNPHQPSKTRNQEDKSEILTLSGEQVIVFYFLGFYYYFWGIERKGGLYAFFLYSLFVWKDGLMC